MYSERIEKLIKLFSKFPTVGPRTAARFIFYLINSSNEEVEMLLETIRQLKEKIKTCSLCSKSFEGEGELCPICSDPRRDKEIVCIVEKEVDLEAIENTNQFKGLYFILGGTVSGLEKKEEKEKLEKRLQKLIERIGEIKEIVLALNPTTEGQNTALWLRRKLEPTGIKITQLGRGLPVGGELEYADEDTLSAALEGRK